MSKLSADTLYLPITDGDAFREAYTVTLENGARQMVTMAGLTLLVSFAF